MTRRVAGLATVLVILAAASVFADPVRIASFNAELSRDGPGLLLRDILSGDDAQILAVQDIITRVAPNILALQGVDWDLQGAALTAFADQLDGRYPHRFAVRPNSGLATSVDLDGDGRVAGAADSQGFGSFTGQSGMAILSRYPVITDEVRDLSDLLWADLPGHLMPVDQNGNPFPSPQAHAVQRLSSTGHWIVPILLPDGTRLTLMTYHAGPPVFDGPEDRNGRRNHDETRIWQVLLDGDLGPPPPTPFVIAGAATLDPDDSDGRRIAITNLLADARLQDPQPRSAGAAAAPDQGQTGDNALDTVDWPAPGPGRLRVDYVLPSADLKIVGAGVFWPAPDHPGHEAALSASRHRLVWVDVIVNPAP